MMRLRWRQPLGPGARRRALLILLGALALAGTRGDLASAEPNGGPLPGSPPRPRLDSPPSGPAPARVAFIATELRAGRSRLYVAAPTPAAPTGADHLAPASSFDHLPDGDVRAAIVPGSDRVLATAPWRAGHDVSFDGALVELAPGQPARWLCRDVVHASSPLVTAEGRVFVARGTAGPWPTDPAAMRVDALRVDEIDLGTGGVRSVHAHEGYLLHLAGWRAPELFLYRVGPEAADIVAVHADSGKLRTLLADLPPFARDFSVDGERGVLVYRGRHESDSRTWTVEELDLAGGKPRRRFAGPTFALAPHAWPGGRVALSPAGRGLALLDATEAEALAVTHPLGPGVDLVRAVSQDGRFVLLLHTEAGRPSVPFVLERPRGTVWRLAVPERARIAVAGFVETDAEGTP